jgi:membrane protease YdiL (CAAX protease family)
MMSIFRKHEVWFFLGLIVVANTLFVSGIVFDVLPQRLYGYGRFALLGVLLFAVVFTARGWSGIDDLLRPMLEWRRSVGWYLFGALWTPVICVCVLLVRWTLGATMPEFSANFSVVTRPDVVVILFFSSFVGEMVWISYAVRRLSRHFTPYVSALIVGAVWTAWWLPMAIYNFGIIPDLPLMALLFNQMGVAAMCTFVYMHTKSGLLVLILQLMFNTTILVLPITPAVAGVTTYWAFAVTYFTAASLLFLIFGPKPLFATPLYRGSPTHI